MAGYFLTTMSGTDVQAGISCDAGSLEEAKARSRTMLADMVRAKLPKAPCEFFAVEIFDSSDKTIVELRLTFAEIDK